jgi:hypothetical protein
VACLALAKYQKNVICTGQQRLVGTSILTRARAKAADKRARGPLTPTATKTATGAFAIVQGMRADGTELTGGIAYNSSPADCENRYTQCEVFSYSEISTSLSIQHSNA